MSDRNILYEVKDAIATLTIHREDKLNAVDRATMEEIAEAVFRARKDPQVGAVILTGAGDKAFAAGADIEELARQDPVGGQSTSLHGQAVLDTLEGLEKPVVAAINGFALGGGLELALACHLRVAAANASMGLPEVTLGIIPGYGGTQRLARLIGRGRAVEMILTGRKVGAEEAERIGLVNRTVPVGESVGAARELAARILRNGPLAISFALRAIRQGLDVPLASGQFLEATLFGLISSTEDMREGLRAFLEK
ncbi:MAG: enoyl-CoA hydratase/isomerase family protein, partial [Acidobacteriota bacterium]